VERRCLACGAACRREQMSCELCGTPLDPVERERFRLDRPDWWRTVDSCVILGGSGVPFVQGDPVRFGFTAQALAVSHADGQTADISIPWWDVTGLSIEGPGKVTSGPVFFGGGFGVRGAITVMAIATLLTALARRTNITTVIHVEMRSGEIYAYNGDTEPLTLRISLSPAFVALRVAHDEVREPR